MSRLERIYNYQEKGVTVPSSQYMAAAIESGHAIVYPQQNIYGQELAYEIQLINTRSTKWILVTALLGSGHTPIGFRDLHINKSNVSWGNGCYGNRNEDFNGFPVPYPEIRFDYDMNPIGVHSFAVLPEYRKQDVGRNLLFTAFEAASLLGATHHVIPTIHDSTTSYDSSEKSYYAQFVKPMYSHFIFTLQENFKPEDAFTIS